MRSEKRNRFLAVLMALVLLASVPVVYLRVQVASKEVSSGDLSSLLDRSSTILDCTGAVITDQETATPDILGNLMGINNYIADALLPAYKDMLGPETFDRITGIRSLEDISGRALKTTLLPLSSQQALADAFCDEQGNSYNGAVFAYNYVTGQVYTALSLPSRGSITDDLPEAALFNKALKGTYTPGSTMKIVAMLCALEQSNVYTGDFRFDCDGVTELPDGNAIICSYAHGNDLTIVDAIGLSCNGFFTEMAAQFDVEEACSSLQRMGFNTQMYQVPQQYADILQRSSSSTVFADPDVFSDRWAFAGQGKTVVSCVDMAMIAGAVANGGQAAEPYFAQCITDLDTGEVSSNAETELRRLFSETVANRADGYWAAACEQYYDLPDAISYAKTGTAEHGNGKTSRSLIGTMKEYNTAFFIYVEGLKSGDTRCMQIAEVLAAELAQYQ